MNGSITSGARVPPGRTGAAVVVAVALVAALLAVAGAPAHAARDIGRLCEPALAQRTQFRDVAPGSVHAQGIYCIAQVGITKGITATRYGPDDPVSRGQMAAFLHRLLAGTTRPVPAVAPGSDVAGHIHAAAIEGLRSAGVVPAGSPFRPDDVIRRDEMAGWMSGTWRWLAGRALTTTGQPFADVAGNPHAADVAALYVHGVINGKDSGYDPAGTVTRAQMGSFLARLMTMHADAGHYPGISALTTTTAPATTAPPTLPPVGGVVHLLTAEVDLLSAHNLARTATGVAPLVRSGCLDELASRWAAHLATTSHLEHRPDFGYAGAGSCFPGRTGTWENVGYNGLAGAMAVAFMASPTHRENVLRPDVRYVGVGAWRDAVGHIWFVVNFVRA